MSFNMYVPIRVLFRSEGLNKLHLNKVNYEGCISIYVKSYK